MAKAPAQGAIGRQSHLVALADRSRRRGASRHRNHRAHPRADRGRRQHQRARGADGDCQSSHPWPAAAGGHPARESGGFTDSPIYARTERLSEEVVFRYRRACPQRPTAGRDRIARSRPAAWPRRRPTSPPPRPTPATPTLSPPLSGAAENRLRLQTGHGQLQYPGSRRRHYGEVSPGQCAAAVRNWSVFEKVYAPFDGVVTARNTDIGR
jgi:hypothetical protein